MNTLAKKNIRHPLIWVKPELDNTIKTIHGLLKNYTENMDNTSVLQEIDQNLYLLRGSLEILEFYGVALLVESMQGAISALQSDKKIKKEDVFESLLQATLSLEAYIDKLHKDQNDLPLSLLPVMNDIRAAIDEPLLSESALFLPNLSIVPKTPGDIPQDYNETCLTDSAKSLRPYYQAALLTWYRDPTDQLSMQQMKLVARNLESSSLTPRNRQIWWILGGLYEALSDNGLKANISLKLLLAQADRILKTLSQENDEQFEKHPPIDLLKNALYYISQATSNGERIKTLKHVYNLNDVIPSDRDISSFKKDLSSPNSDALHAIAKELKKSLDQVKATIDNFVRNSPNDTGRLTQTIIPLKHIADTMSLLSLGNEKQLLQNQIDKISDIVAAPTPPEKEVMLQIASSMLIIEASLKNIGIVKRKQEDSVETHQPLEDLISGDHMTSIKKGRLPDTEYRLLIIKTAEEARNNISEIKNNVLSYLSSDNSQPALIKNIPALLSEIRGSMIMLNNRYLPDILNALSEYVKRDFINTNEIEKQEKYDAFAEALVSIEYYLEAIVEERSPGTPILDITCENLEKLGYPVELAKPEEKAIPTLEAVVTHINEAPARLKPSAHTATQEDIVADNNVLSFSSEEADPEVREIFIEEAFEELGNMEANIKSLKLNPGDTDTLSSMRKIFHTLKGSGKIAGAIELANVAASVDEYLARVLCKSINIDKQGSELLSEAHQLLYHLVECFQNNTSGNNESVEFQNRITNLLNQNIKENIAKQITEQEMKPSSSSDIEDMSQANSDISITADALHTTIDEINREEIENEFDNNLSQLSVIENFISKHIDAGTSAPIPGELNQAIIELKDFAEKSGNKELIQTIELLSKYISNIAKKQEPVNRETLDILAEFCIATREIIADISYDAQLQKKAEEQTEAQENQTEELTPEENLLANTKAISQLESDILQTLSFDQSATQNDTKDTESAVEQIAEPQIESAIEQIPEPQIESTIEQIPEPQIETEPELTTEPSVEPELKIEAEGESTTESDIESEAKLASPSESSPGNANTAIEEDTDSSQISEDNFDLIEIFLEEAHELIEKGHQLIGDSSSVDDEFLAAIQRLLHTLKGSARMAGATSVGNLAHTLETLFESVISKVVTAPDNLVELTQESLDAINDMIEDIQNGADFRPHNELLSRLESASKPPTAEEKIPEAEELPDFSLNEETQPEKSTQHAEEKAISETLDAIEEKSATGDDTVETEEETTVEKHSEIATHTETQTPQATAVSKETESTKEAENIQHVELPAKAKKADQAPTKPRISSEPIKVDASVLDQLVDYATEESAISNRIVDHVASSKSCLFELDKAISRTLMQMRDLQFESNVSRSQQKVESDDNLDLTSFSESQKVAQRLMESIGDIENLHSSLTRLALETDNLVHQQKKIHNQLHEDLLSTRMVTFSVQTQRMQRILRQTCNELNKKAHLVLEGTDGAIDRYILDTAMGPMEHIIRNAIAHGIESPEERLAKNKPEIGTVKVSFSKEKSEHLIVINDDGAGLDLERIRQKALANNLISPDKEYSDSDIANLIFEAGLSTADKISQVAGRGVGMDVVLNTIHELGGTVTIDTEKDKGSTFTIRLPFTLSRNHTLIIKSGNNTYALPSSAIEHTFPVSLTELKELYAAETPVYIFDDSEYPLWYIDTLLNDAPTCLPTASGRANIILIKFGQKRIALHVDNIEETRETVLKPNSPQLSNVAGIAGATVTGDGKVVLIIDIPSLVKLSESSVGKKPQILFADETAKNNDKIKTLIVDDSITVRKVTERFLGRNGILSLTAKDGLEALEVLEKEIPDIVLLDIEMPNMDGLELAGRIKNDERLRHIPIVMITSRTGKQHRHAATETGVDVFLGKPYQESELLGYIQALTGKRINH